MYDLGDPLIFLFAVLPEDGSRSQCKQVLLVGNKCRDITDIPPGVVTQLSSGGLSLEQGLQSVLMHPRKDGAVVRGTVLGL